MIKKLSYLKWVPVGCFMIGLCAVGLGLKLIQPIHDYFYYERNLRKPKTGKTKGL